MTRPLTEYQAINKLNSANAKAAAYKQHYERESEENAKLQAEYNLSQERVHWLLDKIKTLELQLGHQRHSDQMDAADHAADSLAKRLFGWVCLALITVMGFAVVWMYLNG